MKNRKYCFRVLFPKGILDDGICIWNAGLRRIVDLILYGYSYFRKRQGIISLILSSHDILYERDMKKTTGFQM